MTKTNKPGSNRGTGDPDEELWRRVTAEIKPLRKRGRAVSTPTGELEQKRAPPSRIAGTKQTPPVPKGRMPSKTDPKLTHGSAAGLDKRTLTKLRRGQIPVEAEIDLHGRTQDQAHHALESFLARSHASGRRCVLVITGKGLRPDGTGGVLRNAVPRWMNEPPNRERILAFAHATPLHGGEGALYVLLRRSRRQREEFKE